MAAGDITVVTTITGTLTNGESIKGFTNSKTFTSVADVLERTITAPTSSAVTVVTIGATVAGATLTTLNYFRVKNTDASNYITVGLVSATDTAYIKVDAGETFEIGNVSLDTNTSGAAFDSFTSITSITLQANTSSVVCGVLAF